MEGALRIPAWGKVPRSTHYRLFRDNRPVDGQLKELVVSRNEEGTFDATLRTALFDRTKGKGVDETPTSRRV